MKLEFTGVIDCNTGFTLDNINEAEYNVIEKFLRALDHSCCSYMNATTKLINDQDKEIIISDY